MLREGVDRIDEHEGSLRDAGVDEVVRGLEFRQVESQGHLEEVSLDLARADGFRLAVLPLLALLELPLELVQCVPRDLRGPLGFRSGLEAGGLEALVQPGELVVEGLVGDAGAQVVGRRDLARLLRELQGERSLAGARGTLDDERVAPGGFEERHNLARDPTGGGHGRAWRQQKRGLYICFRPGVIREPEASSHRRHGRHPGTGAHPSSWSGC